jgi:hypothetical protein
MVPEPVVIPLVESGIFMIFEFIATADKPALTSSLEILVPVICIVWFARFKYIFIFSNEIFENTFYFPFSTFIYKILSLANMGLF